MKRHTSRKANPVTRAIAPAIESLERRILMSFSAVPTYESAGLYWDPSGGSAAVQATVRYKVAGTTTWKNAQDLWFAPAENGRPAEYRGSILGLKAATTYDVEMDLAGATPPETYQLTTRNDNFPIAQTIVVTDSSTPLEINNVNGTANGYILYTGPATIDVANAQPYNIRIQNSSYVIIRGLTLKGATGDGILLGSSTSSNSSVVKDIVIENNDISGWGSVITSTTLTATEQQLMIDQNWGWDDQSGIRSSSTNLERITIQRNRIHDPRTDSNSWKETNPYIDSMHPNGPQGITFENGTKGGFVIRYNEITSDNNHRFNDGMGADQNFGYGGFPARDSDIYGNVVTYTWDDGYEIEGANMNVRVFGNYADQTYTGVAIAGTAMGPLYVYRNVFGRSQTSSVSGYTSYGGGAFKRQGSSSVPSNGRMYIYNNTLYNQTTPMFQSGVGQAGSGPYATNTIVRNNILRVRNSSDASVRDPLTDASGSSYDYDLYNGVINTPAYVNPQEVNGRFGTPTYVAGSGFNATTGQGNFQLASTSLGFDQGLIINNISDTYNGAAPDIGAHEAGSALMEFGVNAFLPPGARWIGAAGDGNWNNPLNWSNGDVPNTATEYARIDLPSSTVNLTLASGTLTLAGLHVTSGNTLALKRASGDSTGTLLLANLNNAGTITLNHYGSANRSAVRMQLTGTGQTFNIGTITATTNGGRIGETAGINVPAMSRNDGTINILNNTGSTSGSSNFSWMYLTGSGTFTNNGTINIKYTGANPSDAKSTLNLNTANAVVTLGGIGSVVLSTNGLASRAQITGATGATLTNAAGHSIIGAGLIGNNTLAGFTNLGLVNASNGAQIVVDLANGAITNGAGGRFLASGVAGMAVGAIGDSFTNNGTLESLSSSPISAGSNLALASTAVTTVQLGATANPVNVTGALTLDGTLNVTALTGFAAGTYRLFNCAPNTLINNGLTLGALPGGFIYTLSVDIVAGTVDLIVS